MLTTLKKFGTRLKSCCHQRIQKFLDVIHHEGQSYKTSLDKANCFNNFFNNVATKLTSGLPPTPNCEARENLTECMLDTPAVSHLMVSRVIKKLKNVTGTGLDDIPMKLVKILGKSEFFVNALTKLIDASFDFGVAPPVCQAKGLLYKIFCFGFCICPCASLPINNFRRSHG